MTKKNSVPGMIRGIPQPEVGLYPFWFWNGDQKEDEIIRQIRLFHNSGCKGMAIHARHGNRTPYLSDRWFSLIRTACEECACLGLKIWIYDEDGYPSGNAGGRVQKENHDFIQKSLHFGYGSSDPAHPAFAAFNPETWEAVDETNLPKGTELLLFRHIFFKYHVDAFNPDAGKCFVRLTHEKYAEHLSDFFGNVIQAFYTDDENFMMGLGKLPWSEYLEKAWSDRYGTPLRSHLAQLIEDIPGCEEIRVRFYSLAQELFLKNFITPQKDWCESHGLLYLGHLCYDEGPLRIEISGFGSAMPYYRLETIPSVDDFLCSLPSQRYLNEPFNGEVKPGIYKQCRFAPLMLYKKASSVSHQFANDLFSAEVLTLMGWGLTPEYEDKQMLFELAAGVNLITPHAFYYTLGRGTVKDCPPSYSFQQPFFPIQKEMFAKWTRIANMLRRGAFHGDMLLLRSGNVAAMQNGRKRASFHDSESVFEARVLCSMPDLDNYEKLEANTVLRLHRAHIGFDFGDESFLKDASVIDGCLKIGDRSFLTVMLPPIPGLSAESQELLNRFRASGGTVLPHGVFCGLEPDLELAGNGCEEIFVHSRDTKDGREFFLVNLSGRTLNPDIRFTRRMDIYDPGTDLVVHTGDSLPAGFEFPDGSAFFLLTPGIAGNRIPFERSIFAGMHGEENGIRPRFLSAGLLRGNIFAATDSDELTFALSPGASVRTLYFEDMADAMPLEDGKPIFLKPESAPSHPADPCYTGAEASFPPGKHKLMFPEKRNLLALEGEFLVHGDELVPLPETLSEGDLAAQGCPFYWGETEYRYEFEGRFLRAELDITAGAARVFVNGTDCGVIYGRPYRLDIADACLDGMNSLAVRFANTARNFVTSDCAPFGLNSVRLCK